MFSFYSRIDPGFCTGLSVTVLHQDIGLGLSFFVPFGLLQLFGLLKLLWGKAPRAWRGQSVFLFCSSNVVPANKRLKQLLGATGSSVRPVPASRTAAPLAK